MTWLSMLPFVNTPLASVGTGARRLTDLKHWQVMTYSDVSAAAPARPRGATSEPGADGRRARRGRA